MLIERLCRTIGSIAGAAAAAGLSACSTIEIQASDGRVEVKRHLGVLTVELSPAARAQLVSATGIGIIADGRQLIFGYQDLELALLGTDCRLVLWIEKAEHLTAAYELFGNRPDLCVVGTIEEGEE